MLKGTSMIFSWANTRVDNFYAAMRSIVDSFAFLSIIVADRVSVLLLKLYI